MKCIPITAKLQKMQKPFAGSSGPNVAPDGDKIETPAKQTAKQKANLPKEIVNAIAEKEGNPAPFKNYKKGYYGK